MRPAPLRSSKHLSKYWLRQSDFTAMWESQEGSCAICRAAFKEEMVRLGDHAHYFKDGAQIDHDHTTGVVRGLLCKKCNTTIGKLGDQAAPLRRALHYLERPR